MNLFSYFSAVALQRGGISLRRILLQSLLEQHGKLPWTRGLPSAQRALAARSPAPVPHRQVCKVICCLFCKMCLDQAVPPGVDTVRALHLQDQICAASVPLLAQAGAGGEPVLLVCTHLLCEGSQRCACLNPPWQSAQLRLAGPFVLVVFSQLRLPQRSKGCVQNRHAAVAGCTGSRNKAPVLWPASQWGAGRGTAI